MEIAAILAFCCIGLLTVAVGSLGAASRPVKRRLSRLADGTMGSVEEVVRRSDHSRLESALAKLLGPISDYMERNDTGGSNTLKLRLIGAGYRRPSAVAAFMAIRLVLAFVFPVLFLFFAPLWKLTEVQFMTALGGTVVAGLMLPSQYVDSRRAKRQKQIILGLPDSLDLMVVCVEAGLGINASLLRISKEFANSNPILASEFELVTLEIRAGKSSVEALRSLAIRTGVAEVSSLVAMLVQTERFGTNLADTLRVHADTLRVQRMQRAEELAGKAPLKMMFPTLLIFAATLIVTLGPGMIQLTGFFAGTN